MYIKRPHYFSPHPISLSLSPPSSPPPLLLLLTLHLLPSHLQPSVTSPSTTPTKMPPTDIFPSPWLPAPTLTHPYRTSPITIGNLITDPLDPTSLIYEEPNYLDVPVLESRRYDLASHWECTTTPSRTSPWHTSTVLPCGMALNLEYEVDWLDTEVLNRTPHVLEGYLGGMLEGRVPWVREWVRVVDGGVWGGGRERERERDRSVRMAAGGVGGGDAGSKSTLASSTSGSTTAATSTTSTTPNCRQRKSIYLITGKRYATGVTIHTERKIWGPEIQSNHGEEHPIPVLGQTVWVPVWSRRVRFEETHDVVLSYKVMEVVWIKEGQGEGEGGRLGLEEYVGKTEVKDVVRLVEENWDRRIGVVGSV
ncbi:uncharacterized protein BO80DRAFT_488890 [Aspergillus ibericus CBS 121593]|uniref:Uncharacterized protein n=1 Tax=Aspergillus ibericus CBS 121593 TaxID=1448316 RepID=A0A395H7N1_9EURO|nr:hypothetical protein BO80DRAFT_488890 [Aspergillus ibericus CBS 121593]RAL03636.1 hypothetical protein BO80DRAFT_488890 [Aspergillus ibericus CBS 121593]